MADSKPPAEPTPAPAMPTKGPLKNKSTFHERV